MTMLNLYTEENPVRRPAGAATLVNKYRKRLIVKNAGENIVLPVRHTALLYSTNRLVVVFDSNGRNFFADKSLNELTEWLDPARFFRVNRQYLVNIDYIRGYKSYDRTRLLLLLNIPYDGEDLIISQDKAADFRQWIAGN